MREVASTAALIGIAESHFFMVVSNQGLENALIVANEARNGTGKVVRSDRLGGLLGFYYRTAA